MDSPDSLHSPPPPRCSLRRWIVTFGGSGLFPGMPGTWGSLATALLLWLLYIPLDRAGLAGYWTALLILATLLASAVMVALGNWTVAHFAREDPGPCVLDEVAGVCLTMLLQPQLPLWREAWPLLAGFLAFRVFDILKPPPARQLERLPAGWGILLDDLAAAAYANLACQLLLRLVFKIH